MMYSPERHMRVSSRRNAPGRQNAASRAKSAATTRWWRKRTRLREQRLAKEAAERKAAAKPKKGMRAARRAQGEIEEGLEVRPGRKANVEFIPHQRSEALARSRRGNARDCRRHAG